MFTLIGKIFKFFFGLALFFVLAIVLAVFAVRGCANQVNNYVQEEQWRYKDVSYMVWVHEQVEQAPVGQIVTCAICMKDKGSTLDAGYEKLTWDHNCCCLKHEREYQEIYRAWKGSAADRSVLQQYGVYNK